MIDTDLDKFLALRRHLKIAHHIPGRVRLRAGPSVFKELASIDHSVVDRMLQAIDGIEDVRINKVAGSVVVVYAPDTVEPDHWHTLIDGEDADALLLMKSLMNGTTPQETATARSSGLGDTP